MASVTVEVCFSPSTPVSYQNLSLGCDSPCQSPGAALDHSLVWESADLPPAQITHVHMLPAPPCLHILAATPYWGMQERSGGQPAAAAAQLPAHCRAAVPVPAGPRCAHLVGVWGDWGLGVRVLCVLQLTRAGIQAGSTAVERGEPLFTACRAGPSTRVIPRIAARGCGAQVQLHL